MQKLDTKRPTSPTNRLSPWILVVAALAILGLLPFEVSEYQLELLIIFYINVIVATSYRLITTTGDWSLAHIVLMGVGAYAAALISKHAGLPFLVVVPIAGVTAAIVGAAFIFPLLRTVGFGFFIASFAFGELVRLIWVKMQFPFGATRGIVNIPSPEIFGLKLASAVAYYFTCLIVMLVTLAVMYRLDRSRLGNVWKAIHSDAVLAECVGIDVPRYRALAFVIGSFFVGIAGGLLAYRMGAIDPRNFDLTQMVYLIIWVVVGGTTTFWGPIIGLTVITIAGEWTRPLLEWRPLIFGAILILFLIFLPGGIESLRSKIGFKSRRFGDEYTSLVKWLTSIKVRIAGE
jgi:branched-chain amino acid transport system permease protein